MKWVSSIPLPENPHHGRPELGSEHSRPGKEESAETFLRVLREKNPTNAGVLLSLLYSEHPVLLPLCGFPAAQQLWINSQHVPTVAIRQAIQEHQSED